MRRTIFTALLTAAALTAHAQQTIHVPNDVPTIADALNPAISGIQEGDTILIGPGTYTDPNGYTVLIDDLTIRAEIPGTVTLDGDNVSRIFTFDEDFNAEIVFEDLTFTQGRAIATGESDGGAIYAKNKDVTIRGCSFTFNVAADSGGAVNFFICDVLIEDCVFSNNFAPTSAGADNGGAFYARFSDVVIRDTDFNDNVSANRGGAVHCSLSDVEFENCTFFSNSALRGGAISFFDECCGTVKDCLIKENTASINGGAIHSEHSGVVYENCRIMDNIAQVDGGGVYVFGETPFCEADMISCLIVGNTAHGIGAGYMTISGPKPNLYNCTILYNEALGPAGGGVYFEPGSTWIYVHSCIIRDNSPDQYNPPTSFYAQYSNIGDGNLAGDIGVIDVDPMFVDPANGDFRLQKGSPSIDAGDAAYFGAAAQPLDLDGSPRVVTSDADAATGVPVVGYFVDHGAYEYQPTNTSDCPADQNYDGVLTPGDFTAWINNYNQGCD